MAAVPMEQLPSMLVQLAALQSAMAARLALRPTLPASQTSGAPRLVTAKQLATDLSFRLDRVYELARTGRIPSIRIGRAMRFNLEAVLQALAS
jgi:excisionase family DNA binding protein